MSKREINLKVLKSAVNAVLDHLVEDLCAEIREELLAQVQLFVCADNCSPVYTVHLGTNHDGVGFCATGHIYKRLHEYFRLCNDQRRKQSSCEVN